MTAPSASSFAEKNAAPALSRTAAWALALTATLTMAVSYVDRQTLAVIAPTVCKVLDISDRQYALLGSAFAVAYLVGAPIAGRIIDAIGARRGLLGAVLIWSIVAAIHALVPGFGALFALRIALGLAEAPSFPGAAQTVHRALPPADRARGFGVLFTGSSVGAMIAPPVASYIATHFGANGWRYAFLGTAAVGLSWVPIWLIVAFSARSRTVLDRDPAPKKPEASALAGMLDALGHKAVQRATMVVLASAPFINHVMTWGAKYLALEFSLPQASIGRYLWAPPLFFDAGAILFGHLASRERSLGRRGPPRRLMGVSMVIATAIAWMPMATTPGSAMAFASVSLIGGGGLYALTTSDMLSRVPPTLVGSAGGICAAAQSIAQIVANMTTGFVVQESHSYAAITTAVGLWVIPGTLIWLMWEPPQAVDS